MDRKEAEPFKDKNAKILRDGSFQSLRSSIAELKKKYNLSINQILGLLENPPLEIPVSVFENKELSALELICRYLRESLGLSFHEIAELLGRDNSTIWATNNKSLRKRKEALAVKKSYFFIPISIFRNRKFSVLEAVVKHLRENYGLGYSQISRLINRDQRNVWTVYSRARRKDGER